MAEPGARVFALPVVLFLPWPPSVNTYWRSLSRGKLAGRVLVSEKGRAYRKTVGDLIAANRVVGFSVHRVAVDIEACPPDRRKRDLDNLPKAVLDALTHAGLWVDDSQVDDLRIWRSPHRTGEIVVTIRPMVTA